MRLRFDNNDQNDKNCNDQNSSDQNMMIIKTIIVKIMMIIMLMLTMKINIASPMQNLKSTGCFYYGKMQNLKKQSMTIMGRR